MKVIDKRTSTTTKDFDDLPIGTVFEFPEGSEKAEDFGICMKIASTEWDDNVIDLEDCGVFTLKAKVKVCELNAHLTIEGR